MEKVNFREVVFRGTLAELLEQGKLEFCHSAKLAIAHEWLRLQLRQAGNILPVRKCSEYPLRGSTHSIAGSGFSFVPTDNEPLAHLYQHWTQGNEISTTIGIALTQGKIRNGRRADYRISRAVSR
jgi:hypothetical protein